VNVHHVATGLNKPVQNSLSAEDGQVIISSPGLDTERCRVQVCEFRNSETRNPKRWRDDIEPELGRFAHDSLDLS
jgi:hypothetical protein